MFLGMSILIVIFGLNQRWNAKARLNVKARVGDEKGGKGRNVGEMLLGLINHHSGGISDSSNPTNTIKK